VVLFNLVSASYVLLGVILGIETLFDGIAMMLVGRVRVSPAGMGHPGVVAP